MPIYDPEFEMDLSLEDKIKEMAEAFGPHKFLQVLNQMDWVPKNTTTGQPAEHVLLQEAVEFYFSNASFMELAESSQKTYRYEMGMFIEFCNKHFSTDPDFKSVCTSLFLSSYVTSVDNKNTRSKKAAFLRNFLRTILDHFYDENIDKLKRVLEVKVDKRRLPRAFTKEQIDELSMLARLGRESYRILLSYGLFLVQEFVSVNCVLFKLEILSRKPKIFTYVQRVKKSIRLQQKSLTFHWNYSFNL
ncbi:hypothetical protein [Paenibacillus sp. Marseille-Q9583]